MLTIFQARSIAQIDAERELFREYEKWLGINLCFQGFEAELAGLPGKYTPPSGRLLLAYQEEKLAGCVALRKLENEVCEMKRLFIRDIFRREGIGLELTNKLIIDAKEIGYEKMRLDTYPAKMQKAVKLYKSHGFRVIESYYENPHEGVLFMEKML